jgi:hypothetical protein
MHGDATIHPSWRSESLTFPGVGPFFCATQLSCSCQLIGLVFPICVHRAHHSTCRRSWGRGLASPLKNTWVAVKDRANGLVHGHLEAETCKVKALINVRSSLLVLVVDPQMMLILCARWDMNLNNCMTKHEELVKRDCKLFVLVQKTEAMHVP